MGKHNPGSQGMGASGRATEHAALGPFKTTVHALDGGGKVLGLLMGMWNLDRGTYYQGRRHLVQPGLFPGEKTREQHLPRP